MNEEQRNSSLKKLFEQTDLTAAGILLEEGAKGFDRMNESIEKQATVAEIAATKMDNLKGDWEKLMGTLDTLLISGGASGNGPLRGFLQDADATANALAKVNREWTKLSNKLTGGSAGRNAIGGDEPGFFGATKEFFQANESRTRRA